MSDPLRICFCASEVVPYAKTGGLADVAGALPRALAELGCDVRIVGQPTGLGVRNDFRGAKTDA